MGFEDLIALLVRRWKLILACFSLCLLCAGAYVAFSEPVYRSQAQLTLAPSPDSSLSGLSGQLGGLASLAGIQIAGQGERDEVIAILNSRYLLGMFVEQQSLLPILFRENFDSAKSDWRTDRRPPTLNDGVRAFREIYSVNQDRKTGILTLTVDWNDRILAAEWATKIIELANAEARRRAIANASRSITYLDRELASTSLMEMREMLFRLKESQLQALTYARSNPEYSFRIIDPPVASDKHRPLRPRPAIAAAAGFLIGLLLSIAAVSIAESALRLRGLRLKRAGQSPNESTG